MLEWLRSFIVLISLWTCNFGQQFVLFFFNFSKTINQKEEKNERFGNMPDSWDWFASPYAYPGSWLQHTCHWCCRVPTSPWRKYLLQSFARAGTSLRCWQLPCFWSEFSEKPNHKLMRRAPASCMPTNNLFLFLNKSPANVSWIVIWPPLLQLLFEYWTEQIKLGK